MISICCVGFASLDVAMNLMIVSGILVCSNFLKSVCILILSKALLISSATVIVRTRGTIWLNPFAVVLCFVPVLRGCVWHVCCYARKKDLLQCLCNY